MAWGVVIAFFAAQVAEIERGVHVNETHFVNLLGKSLVQNLNSVVGDLRFLSESRTLKRYLGSPHIRNRNELHRAYVRFVEAKQVYDQVRYMDETGADVAVATLEEEGAEGPLTGDSHRRVPHAMLKDPARLAEGDVLISPMSVATEEGLGDLPSRPLIHLAAPVFDGNGDPRGAVVIDYLARYFLEVVFDLTAGSHGQVMLLDGEGHWLVDPNADSEPVGDAGTRGPKSFATRHPDVWEAMRSNHTGSLETDEGLFYFGTVRPAFCAHLRTQRDTSVLPVWYVVSHVSRGAMAVLEQSTLEMACLLGLVLFAIILLVSWIIASATLQRERTEDALRDREALYRTLAENFPNGAVILLDLHMTCVLAKGKGLDRLGLVQEKLLGSRILDVFPEGVRAEVDGRLKEALAGVEQSFEIPIGNLIYHVYAVPVKGVHGEVFAEMLVTQDITERKMMEERLREAATMDALTGLLNRRRLIETTEASLRHARRYGTPLCLCMCDIDHFKDINDTHGHGTGDLVLVEYADLLRRSVRETDFVGRYGGDEFSVLLTNTCLEEAVRVIERIRLKLNAAVFQSDRGVEFRVTGSFGVAAFDPSRVGVTEFFSAADSALYEAKRSGRDRVVGF